MSGNKKKTRKKLSVKKSNRNSLRRQTIRRAYIDLKSTGAGSRALEVLKCAKKKTKSSKKTPTESASACVAEVKVPDNLTLDTQNVGVWKVEVATLDEIQKDISMRANANQNCVAVVMNFNDCSNSTQSSSEDLAKAIEAMKAVAANLGSGKKK